MEIWEHDAERYEVNCFYSLPDDACDTSWSAWPGRKRTPQYLAIADPRLTAIRRIVGTPLTGTPVPSPANSPGWWRGSR